MTSPKIIIYTGAPLSSSLSFSESHLTAPLQPPFLFKAQDVPLRVPSHSQGRSADHNESLATAQGPVWRHLSLKRQHLPTGLTQGTPNVDYYDYHPVQLAENERETPFLSTTDRSIFSSSPDDASCAPRGADDREREEPGNEGVLSQYYEHSFALHDEVPSSRVLPADSYLSTTVSSSPPSQSSSINPDEEDSTIYSTLFPIGDPSHNQKALQKLLATPITNVKDMPNATYLRSIEPQTMTVNLLVGAISIPAPRTIVTRKTGTEIQLMEMIVGDETRAGFGVNIWLPPPSTHQSNDGKEFDMRKQLEGLRPRDIVLMRNIALTSFRGKVYGQSLRRGMTRVELVHRMGGEGDGVLGAGDLDPGKRQGMEGAVLMKVKRVREWVLAFVGGGVVEEGREGKEMGQVVLPADTQ
ncbi:MAG: hypothetical protein Q9182_003594 [Xanthomendoza sp. 2 TL-2023]